MKYLRFFVFTLFAAHAVLAEGDLSAVWPAIEQNDPRALRQSLVGVDGNITRAADGHTPLTLAVSLASFECARELLWAGVKADLPDKNGRIARSYLKIGTPNFTSLNLLLRAYIFAQKEAGNPERSAVPYRVVINDAYVDPNHPDYRHRYWINKAESTGKSGIDDDNNGFIDDATGWNMGEDLPLRMPSLALDSIHNRAGLERLVSDYLSIKDNTADDPETLKEELRLRYENPLAKQLGIRIAKEAGFNDFFYAAQLSDLSHGTHVAGIVLAASAGTAEMHGVSWEAVEGSKKEVWQALLEQVDVSMRSAAVEQPDYAGFMQVVRGDYLAACVKAGRRYSDYLRSCGAGIVNMSYAKESESYRKSAETIQTYYREHGKNPASMESFVCPVGLDLCGSLALELQIADSSFFAVAMARNPNVLFVAAAGNSNVNNDVDLPTPSYLSRFFPNVISVASVGDSQKLSEFSNFGVRSVQIAARGENITSSYLGGLRHTMSGTSMAAPEVAGVAAALRFAYPDLTATEVRRILLASAKPSSNLKGKIATSAVVDRERALQLASSWERGLALFVDETWDWPSSPDQAPIIHGPPTQPAVPPAGAGKQSGGQSSARPTVGISAIGGFGENWRVVATTLPQPRHQFFNLSKTWPTEWLHKAADSGHRIAALGGDPNGWAIVTTESPMIGAQKLVGYTFDQTSLKSYMDDGYRIRCVAGYDSQWVFVMDKSTGYGEQRYTLPGPFDDKRKAWISARWKEGLAITSVAGENGPEEKFSWAMVMSSNAGVSEQTYAGPGPWPAKWIDEQWKKGFFITSHTGYGEAWLVIMSKGAFQPSAKQSCSDQLTDPRPWIEEILK